VFIVSAPMLKALSQAEKVTAAAASASGAD
jgi:hypothetical protein